jgi:hypothetical protein
MLQPEHCKDQLHKRQDFLQVDFRPVKAADFPPPQTRRNLVFVLPGAGKPDDFQNRRDSLQGSQTDLIGRRFESERLSLTSCHWFTF